MVAETVATGTEMPMADDHERRKHPVREPMRATATRRILANCVDTSQGKSLCGGGFLKY